VTVRRPGPAQAKDADGPDVSSQASAENLVIDNGGTRRRHLIGLADWSTYGPLDMLFERMFS
jgi:hypothetical protein